MIEMMETGSRITITVRNDLLQAANSFLDGTPLEETAERALEEFITYRHLLILAKLDFDELTPQALAEIRLARFQASE